MGGDDDPVDLLVRVVGQCEDGPVARRIGGGRFDLDAAHDAVRAGHRRDLEIAAPIAKDLDRRLQIDRDVLAADRHGRQGMARPCRQTCDQQRQEAQDLAGEAVGLRHRARAGLCSQSEGSSGCRRHGAALRPVVGQNRVEQVILPDTGDFEILAQVSLAAEADFSRSRIDAAFREGRRPPADGGAGRRRRTP